MLSWDLSYGSCFLRAVGSAGSESSWSSLGAGVGVGDVKAWRRVKDLNPPLVDESDKG